MAKSILRDAEIYASARRQKRRWYRIVTCLAAVVVFCTTYALILPAITLERQCELPEHTHTDACYTQVTSREIRNSICTVKADVVVHKHDSTCYDKEGNLWCTLPEVEAHRHTDACYAQPEAHTHTDACYTQERGKLICTESTEPSHQHTDACYTETPELVCTEEHEHSEGCYAVRRELTCTEAPAHTHTDACYEWSKVLACGKSTTPGAPELACGKEEVILHTHKPYVSEENPGCYDADGKNLVCGKSQVLEHQHTEACFETVTEAVDTEALTCTLPEDETHTHTARCYGTWVLTCGLEEHTHGEECAAATDTEAQTQSEWEEPSGLPVVGTAYAAPGRMRTFSVMLLDDGETSSDPPLDVTGYITGATLTYSTDGGTNWQDANDAENVPGNAKFKLNIAYGGVNIDDLLGAGGKMTYALPDLLRNATTLGTIFSGSQEVGTISVDGSTVTLAFDTTWLQSQKTETNTVINGDFYVEAEADLSKIQEGMPGVIQIGTVDITIDFADDIIAQYGQVEIKKEAFSISKEEGVNYLTYKLTVTAGQDGCPDVKVVDQFADSTYISEYVGVTGEATATNDTDGPTETGGTGGVYIGAAPTEEKPIPDPAGDSAAKPGTLVWVIGKMKANETRTLTYRVKLTDAYTDAAAQVPLQNTADLYSQTYQRDSDTVTFTPNVGAKVTKAVSSVTRDSETGMYKIAYKVVVTANADNNCVMDHVTIKDALDASVSIPGKNPTNDTVRSYLHYDADSFQCPGGTGPNFPTGEDTHNSYFTYDTGPLQPGQSKTLTYSVIMAPDVYIAHGNSNFYVNNSVQIYAAEDIDDSSTPLGSAYNTKKMDRKVWDRKLVGEALDGETIVTMSGDAYDATGTEVTKIDTPDSSFTVPAGSYMYQVVVNETANWNLTSASLQDTLSDPFSATPHLQFTGYVQVNAYKVGDYPPTPNLSDEGAIKNISGQDLAKTVWVKVDGTTSFSFKPSDLGIDGQYAYILTYYAKPVNTDNITMVRVTNTFGLSGEVGIGEKTYQIVDGIKAEATVDVESSDGFSASKAFWYYEAPRETTGAWVNGALYWCITIDGKINPGTMIEDAAAYTGGNRHYFYSDSLIGIYTGTLGNIKDYASVSELPETLNLLDSSYYETEIRKNSDNRPTRYVVTFLKEIALNEGESLYIILKSASSGVPSTESSIIYLYNALLSSTDDQNWFLHGQISKYLYGVGNVNKKLGKVFRYTGSGDITVIQDSTQDKAIKNSTIDIAGLQNKAGTYVSWQIRVNYGGNLSGRYRLDEKIPDGLEVAYVRRSWVSAKYGENNLPIPESVQLTADEKTALGTGWSEQIHTSDGVQDYFYSNGQDVVWDVGNLYAGDGSEEYLVEFQVVCRVTDPDVLLGSKEKKFNNSVSLLNADGENMGNSTCSATVQSQTLKKESTYKSQMGGRYPFKITLNDLGEDLVNGSDTVTLVDTLSDTLTLDSRSIRVVNTNTKAEVTGWTSSVEDRGQTLKLVLPDNLPLTITYDTNVNALPEASVAISNIAHWEGYTTPSDCSVVDESFSYAAGATVGASVTPSVTIKKLNQYNTSELLPGAEFELVEGTYNGTFTATAGGLSLTGSTDSDGTLTFGKENGQAMKFYNDSETVYRLTETKAPDGFALDAAPHYFAIVKQNDDKTYPSVPTGVTAWSQSADYVYQAYNHKGEATVTKAFQDENGNDLEKIDGTYRFGIYTEANPTGDPLQKVSVTYANGTGNGTAKFTDLTLGETYYIFELDDSGDPIPDGDMATVSGMRFAVTYENGPAVTIPADAAAATPVVVTNRVCYPELPLTGGAGTGLYTAAGLLLTTAAGVCLLYRRKKRRKGDTVSFE